MKVLFVGEGPHDIGASPPYANEPYPAGGVVTHLARRVVPAISEGSVAMRWTEVVRFRGAAGSRAPREKGLAAKAAAAVLIARVRCGCAGVVLCVDRDGREEEGRLAAMKAGSAGAFPAACGEAVESIEAWTLGAPAALADELGMSLADVRAELHAATRGRHVESLLPQGPTPPKQVLERIAARGHRLADTPLREAVASRTDTSALEEGCPLGFGPFAAELRAAFGRGAPEG